MKQNITLALDRKLLKAARALAARHGTSISAMLAEELRAKVEQQTRHEHARQAALAMLARPWSLGGQGVQDREALRERSALR